MKFEGFCGPWYATQGYAADSQRLINYYPETVESGQGKNDIVLRGTPGLIPFATLPAAPVRGLLSAGAPLTGAPRLFAVGGANLYEVSSGGAPTLLGVVGTDAANTPAQMELNGNQLFTVSAGQAYLDNGAGPVSAGIPTARTGCYIDGYFIVQRPASRQFDISALENGLAWDPLDFALKGSYPDHIGSIIADHHNLFLFGESASEQWQHTGAPDFPFERNPSGSIHQGIAAPWSACRVANGVAWLGADQRGKLVAWWIRGATPERISNYAIENLWDASTVSDAIGFVQVVKGHQFWWLSFPTMNRTLIWDATNRWWHERAWWNGAAIERHRARCHAHCFGKHLIGDHSTGVIYEMVDSAPTDNGVVIHRIRQTPHIHNEEQRLFHHELRLDAVSLTSVNPTFYMQYSKDNGVNWTAEVPLTGAAGFKHERSWRRLGSGRDRIYSIRTDVPANVTLINAFLDISKGGD